MKYQEPLVEEMMKGIQHELEQAMSVQQDYFANTQFKPEPEADNNFHQVGLAGAGDDSNDDDDERRDDKDGEVSMPWMEVKFDNGD